MPLVKEGEDFLSSLTIENEEYYIESFDGLRLCARRIGENKKRLIILFHGFRSTPERDFGYISKSLLETCSTGTVSLGCASSVPTF